MPRTARSSNRTSRPFPCDGRQVDATRLDSHRSLSARWSCPMPNLSFGILLWNQATDWPSYLEAARKVDRLGYTHLWAWDHLYAIFGDPYQPIYEGWASLSA